MQTQLILKVPAADIDRVRAQLALAGPAPETATEQHLVDTYYDTAARELWKRGLSLRVRLDGARWIQTVASANDLPTGLRRRGEWECELPDGQPQPALLASHVKPAALAELLRSEDLAASLVAQFAASIRRTTWGWSAPDGQQFECVLDTGDISVETGSNISTDIAARSQHAAVSVLRLVLKQGDPARLYQLALDLHHAVPLQVAAGGTAARGHALIEQGEPSGHKAAPLRLRRKMTLEDAFLAIGENCLHQIEANVPGVLVHSPESLHQMRVGLRRLRALAGMFDGLAPAPAAVREDLDWLKGELGAARDWDVLAGSTLERIAGLDPAALRQAAEAKAESLHRQLAQTLRAPRFTAVLLRLRAWLHGRAWRVDGVLDKDAPLAAPARRAMRPLLRKAGKRLDKRIAGLDPADTEARHRTRIAAKKARYAAEFFQDLLPARRVQPYVGRLSKLQDKLGMLNDYAVAGRLLDELKGSNAQVARQAAYARGFLAASTAAQSARLGKVLASVAGRRISG